MSVWGGRYLTKNCCIMFTQNKKESTMRFSISDRFQTLILTVVFPYTRVVHEHPEKCSSSIVDLSYELNAAYMSSKVKGR
jgi:hypothetical protein